MNGQKNVVHQPLKSNRNICQIETQHEPLEVTEWRAESSLRHIIIRHTDLMVTLCQVRKAEYMRSS